MRVTLVNPNKLTVSATRQSIKEQPKLQSSQNPQHINSISSPIYYSPQFKSLSFKAAATDTAGQRRIQDEQLMNLQERKQQLRGKLEFLAQYNEAERTLHYQQLIEEERAKLSWWARNFSPNKNSEIVHRHSLALQKELLYVANLREELGNMNKEWDLIEKGEITTQQAIKKLDEIDKQWKELEEAQRLKTDKAQRINDIIKGKGGLDERIAGYEEQKKAVTENILKPIMNEIDTRVEQKVPNAMLFYGATGTGKTTFTEALINNIKLQGKDGEKVKVHVETLDIPNEKDFITDVRGKLNKAIERYNNSISTDETGTRTIYVINEIDKHLDKTKAATSDAVRNNIDYMKTILDECAKLPNPNNNRACGTTFLFTTNYPTRIHDDLLRREGKIGLKIALNPAEKNDIAAILKFYTQKAAQIIQESYPALKIDTEAVPFEMLAEKLQPDLEKGAFSNDSLEHMIMRSGAGKSAGALQRYIDDPAKSFAGHLADVALTEVRDLQKDRFDEFVNIYKAIEGEAIDQLTLLTEKETMGLLETAEKETLNMLRRLK